MKTQFQRNGLLLGQRLTREQLSRISGGDDPTSIIRCYDSAHVYLGGIGVGDCPANKAEICAGQFPETIYSDCSPGGLE